MAICPCCKLFTVVDLTKSPLITGEHIHVCGCAEPQIVCHHSVGKYACQACYNLTETGSPVPVTYINLVLYEIRMKAKGERFFPADEDVPF